MTRPALKHILEAALLAAGDVVSMRQLEALFEADDSPPDRGALREALASLETDYADRGIELVEVASGFRLQSRASMAPWLARLEKERPPRYSRALLETLVLVAYRQPITRGEIEEVRGVSVSSGIVRTLLEREWIREVGIKEVPGRPALFGTTRQFLDYFGLRRLEDLPPLSELKDLDTIGAALANGELGAERGIGPSAANDAETGAPAPAHEPETVLEPESATESENAPEPEAVPESQNAPDSEPIPDGPSASDGAGKRSIADLVERFERFERRRESDEPPPA